MNAGLQGVVVRAVSPVALDVSQLELARFDGSPLLPFTPGAHVDLHLAPGVVRQYSLCGELDDPHYTIAVKREPGSRGGSRFVHEQLRPGVPVTVSAPRNHFALEAEAPHSVLLAGGIGVTPLLCMARDLSRRGRSFTLHYFARSEEQAAFAQLLTSPRFSRQARLHFGLGRAATAEALREALAQQQTGARLYLCGPGPFMDMVRGVAIDRGWPNEHVRHEHLAADTSSAVIGTRSIAVKLARSGRVVDVPAGLSIADALRAAGVPVQTSCEQGVCGTCVTAVVDGVPEHHDLFLTDAERESGRCMATCVSRARTPHLVLDL